jgi:hypothetical protein
MPPASMIARRFAARYIAPRRATIAGGMPRRLRHVGPGRAGEAEALGRQTPELQILTSVSLHIRQQSANVPLGRFPLAATAAQDCGARPVCALLAQLCTDPLHTRPPPAVGSVHNCASHPPLVQARRAPECTRRRPRASNSRMRLCYGACRSLLPAFVSRGNRPTTIAFGNSPRSRPEAAAPAGTSWQTRRIPWSAYAAAICVHQTRADWCPLMSACRSSGNLESRITLSHHV